MVGFLPYLEGDKLTSYKKQTYAHADRQIRREISVLHAHNYTPSSEVINVAPIDMPVTIRICLLKSDV